MKFDIKIAEKLSLEKKGWYLDYILLKEPLSLALLSRRWNTSRTAAWRFIREINPEIDKETKQVEEINFDGLLVWFNNMVNNTSIPQIQKIDYDRKRNIRARVSEYGKTAIDEVMRKVLASDFLTGRDGAFVATFDWIFKKNNFKKIIEGNYDNRINNTHKPTVTKNESRRNLINEARRVLASVPQPIHSRGSDI